MLGLAAPFVSLVPLSSEVLLLIMLLLLMESIATAAVVESVAAADAADAAVNIVFVATDEKIAAAVAAARSISVAAGRYMAVAAALGTEYKTASAIPLTTSGLSRPAPASITVPASTTVPSLVSVAPAPLPLGLWLGDHSQVMIIRCIRSLLEYICLDYGILQFSNSEIPADSKSLVNKTRVIGETSQ